MEVYANLASRNRLERKSSTFIQNGEVVLGNLYGKLQSFSRKRPLSDVLLEKEGFWWTAPMLKLTFVQINKGKT